MKSNSSAYQVDWIKNQSDDPSWVLRGGLSQNWWHKVRKKVDKNAKLTNLIKVRL